MTDINRVTTLVQQARNPQEAMLAIASALDRIEYRLDNQESQQADPWGGTWTQAPPEETFTPHEAMQVATFGDTTEVTLPVVSDEVRGARREFAKQYLHLTESEGFDAQVDWEDAYSKGGPLWLHAEAREHVMRLPYGTRQAMVVDVQQNGTLQEAVDLGADILKQSGEEGPGSPAMQIGQQLGGGGE